MHIRLQGPTDIVRVLAVNEEAFGPQEGPLIAKLVNALQDSDAFTGQSFVAVDDDEQIVGHTMLTRSWLDAPDKLVDVAVLSPLAVLESHRGRGVARDLVRKAVSSAEAAGYPLVALEGDPAFYSRFGFEPAAEHGITPPSARIPEAACQVVTLAGYQNWMRGALVYCDRFWAYDAVGLRETTN